MPSTILTMKPSAKIFCDENGKVELINGEIIDFDRLLQDGMDAIAIELIDPQGKQREIVREELA